MTTRREWGGVLWLDAENPTAKEIRALVEEFKVPPEVGEELVRPTWKPRAERHGESIHVTLHFPIARRKKSETGDTDYEIDFVVGRRFLATVRYHASDVFYQIGKKAETAALVEKTHNGHGVVLFTRIIGTLYDALFADIGSSTERLGKIEREVFSGKERAMVEPLSEAGRELLDIQRAVSFHKELLESFNRAAAAAYGGEVGAAARPLLSDLARLEFAVRRNLDLLSELRETNNSLLNARETAVMRVIAVVAFLTLPASIITNFFQMSTAYTPLVGSPNDWLYITGASVGLTVLLLAIAKTKKWL